MLGTAELESRPEGIVLTQNHIWTSGAILNRADLNVLLDNQSLGFTSTRGPDGSIWGTGGVPGSSIAEGVETRGPGFVQRLTPTTP